MTEEEKRLANRVSILRGLFPPFVCAIYNGQARDWDREDVLSMLTNKDNLNGESLLSRLTEDDVSAYIGKLFRGSFEEMSLSIRKPLSVLLCNRRSWRFEIGNTRSSN